MSYYPEDVIEALKRKLTVRNYSPRTVETYVYCVRNFLRFAGKALNVVSKRDVQLFLEDLSVRKKSSSTLNVNHMALKFVFEEVLDKKMYLKIGYSRTPKRLPTVLSRDEMSKLLEAFRNPKHRLIFKLMYGAGLRVSEVCNLKVCDLNGIHGLVRMGKGRKDRLFIIPLCIKDEIEEIAAGENEYLFRTVRGDRFSVRTLQEILKDAVRESGIKKDIHCHTLRHSFATHLIEYGYSVTDVQTLLGHSNVRTSMVYIHTASPRLLRIKSPLDMG